MQFLGLDSRGVEGFDSRGGVRFKKKKLRL